MRAISKIHTSDSVASNWELQRSAAFRLPKEMDRKRAEPITRVTHLYKFLPHSFKFANTREAIGVFRLGRFQNRAVARQSQD